MIELSGVDLNKTGVFCQKQLDLARYFNAIYLCDTSSSTNLSVIRDFEIILDSIRSISRWLFCIFVILGWSNFEANCDCTQFRICFRNSSCVNPERYSNRHTQLLSTVVPSFSTISLCECIFTRKIKHIQSKSWRLKSKFSRKL